MSRSITTGCSETGCIITGDDVNYFIKKYISLNPCEFEDLNLKIAEDRIIAEDYVREWLDTNEAFKYSRDAGEEGGEEFYARIMRDDPYYPQMYFMPISDAFEYRSEEHNLIFVKANFGCYAKAVLRGDFYKSKEELLVQEMKDKLSRYLPENFDWEANIGDLDYASSF